MGKANPVGANTANRPILTAAAAAAELGAGVRPQTTQCSPWRHIRLSAYEPF